MRKIIPSLLCGLLSVGFAACSTDEAEDVVATPETFSATFHIKQTGVGVIINENDPDYEETKVENVYLAGAMTGNYGGVADPTFTILSYQGKKNFLFAANLNSGDVSKISTETDYNNAVLTTAEYMRGYGTIDAKKPLLMAGSLRSVSFQNGVLSQDLVTLQRVFASIDYNFSTILDGGGVISKIVLKNIPAKFRLAGALVDYDLLNAKSDADYPYIDWELPTAPRGRIYVPEHIVSKPVFNDPDVNRMTYFEITYTLRGTTYTHKLRVAESRPLNINFGRIMRNTRYIVTSNSNVYSYPGDEWGN